MIYINMDTGFYLIMYDSDSLTNKNNDLYIYLFNDEISMREKYALLLCTLFMLATCCSMYLCMLKDTNSKKNVYNIV